MRDVEPTSTAALAQYAVQRGGFMWQYVARIEPAVQRPRPRREILELESKFDNVMNLCNAAMEVRVKRSTPSL